MIKFGDKVTTMNIGAGRKYFGKIGTVVFESKCDGQPHWVSFEENPRVPLTFHDAIDDKECAPFYEDQIEILENV